MSKVSISEDGSISISELRDGESFDVEVTDALNIPVLFRYTVPESGGDNVITFAAGRQDNVFGQTAGIPDEGQIKSIRVTLSDGDLVKNHSLEDSGEFITHARKVEIFFIEPVIPGADQSVSPFVIEETDLALRGVFVRQGDASESLEEIPEETSDSAVTVSYQYDKESRLLRLSGNFLFQENAYSPPFNVSEVLVYSVDESAWLEKWREWTADNGGMPDPGKALTISGKGIVRWPGEDGQGIVIIRSDESVQFSLNPGGAGAQATVIFSKAAESYDVSVSVENDTLELRFTSPHILITGDTVWQFDAGERLIISDFDKQSWDAAIQSGGISGEFSIHGGTAQIKDGVHQISGTQEDQVRLDYTATAETILVQHDGRMAETSNFPLLPLILGGALVVACAVIAILAGRCRKAQKGSGNARGREGKDTDLPVRQDEPRPAALRVGRLQNIGKRPGQQDSMGVISVQGGVFAVVADGMGGLSDGDKVSQKIVQTMLGDVNNRPANQIAENMAQLVAHANSEVNQMLGYSNQYKSGSTLLAVMAEPGRFHWIAVGDSRIYLYRGGSIIQMNHEHVLEMELVTKAVNRELSFQEARGNKKKGSVTSFIGMGELRYIDMSLGPVSFLPGDKILLMSDGVFNTLSETELSALLEANPDPAQAAKVIEAGVLARNRPHQDNFSCIIIDYS